MKQIFSALFVVFTLASLEAFSQCSISISPIHAWCQGNTVTFTRNCTGNYTIFTWSVNGSSVATGTSFSLELGAPGSYTVGLYAECPDNGTCSPVGSTTASTSFTVTSALTLPIVTASGYEFCESASVNFSVTNPQSGVSYTWTSSLGGGSLGTGTSLSSYSMTQSATITATATQGNCISQNGSVNVNVAHTTFTPSLLSMTYRSTTASMSGEYSNPHYWQTSSTGTSTTNSGNTYTTNAAQTVYLRAYNSSGGCWTNASTGLSLTIDYAPLLASVTQVHKPGYTDVVFVHPQKDFLMANADYYWVSDASSSPSIVSNYSQLTSVTGSRVTQSGEKYLKGRDHETNTWGSTLTLDVTLRGDEMINSVQTTGYDGSSTPVVVAQSKSYFDNRGKPLQSQSKNIEQNYILATQGLTDRFDRPVGATLPAPIVPKSFTYNSLLLLNASGVPYSHPDFDYVNPTNSNDNTRYDPVHVGSSVEGTVGWYYSANNTIEPLTPQTFFPYSRVEYYEDASGETKRSASAGNQHRLGAGHEALSGTFPVFNELDDYLSRRSTALTGITQDGSLRNEAVQKVTMDENGNYSISVTDNAGKTVMVARKGTSADSVLKVKNTVVSSSDPASSNYRKMTYFYILNDFAVTITGSTDFVAENIVTEEKKSVGATFANGSGIWSAGFYRITVNSGSITLKYTNYYLDVSYQFYDDAGRLKTSVSPNGVKKWKENSNPSTYYSVLDKSTFTYNHRSWLLSMTETDAGLSTYKYRTDGKIRFSQNKKQQDSSWFSYTHYDVQGRPIESGEYRGTSYTYSGLASQLEYTNQVIFPAANVRHWTKTIYDLPDANFIASTGLPATYKQTFIRGAVSSTENANNKTWYSYDGMGRLRWIAQKPNGFGLVFVSEYGYDFLGNVTVTSTKAFSGSTAVSKFYHHYTYDKDMRLSEVKTSLDSVKKTLQAKYLYYVHGPLKRIELATSLQGIDFVYNINGWLQSINNPSGDPGGDGQSGAHGGFRPDAFSLVLDYYESTMSGLFSSIVQQIDPRKFHRIPGLDENSSMEIAGFTPRQTLSEASLWEVRRTMEMVREKMRNQQGQ